MRHKATVIQYVVTPCQVAKFAHLGTISSPVDRDLIALADLNSANYRAKTLKLLVLTIIGTANALSSLSLSTSINEFDCHVVILDSSWFRALLINNALFLCRMHHGDDFTGPDEWRGPEVDDQSGHG